MREVISRAIEGVRAGELEAELKRRVSSIHQFVYDNPGSRFLNSANPWILATWLSQAGDLHQLSSESLSSKVGEALQKLGGILLCDPADLKPPEGKLDQNDVETLLSSIYSITGSELIEGTDREGFVESLMKELTDLGVEGVDVEDLAA